MPKEYTLPDGRKLKTGPFTLRGFQFPQNWFDIAVRADLDHWSITAADVADPAPPPAPTVWSVRRSTIVDRLNTAGKLAAAKTALGNASIYQQERWYSHEAFSNTDAALVALLNGIGADPAVILAIEA